MKAGFTLGSAMSSARSFSVRVMRQQLNDRTQSCRDLGGKQGGRWVTHDLCPTPAAKLNDANLIHFPDFASDVLVSNS
jgi:hypothetical protein